jgi:hypothetical protein
MVGDGFRHAIVDGKILEPAISMTVRYSHLAPKHTLAAVERLDAPTGEATDTTTDTRDSGRLVNLQPILQQMIQ